MNDTIREDAEAADSAVYRLIKVAMLMHTPFFASLLLDMMTVRVGKFPYILGDDHPTAGTDGLNIWLDRDFLASLKLEEQVFLVCHELAHAMWNHMPRGRTYTELGFEGKPFKLRQWNQAGDYVINAMLVGCRLGHMPKGGLLDLTRFSDSMSVDEAYRILDASKPPQKKQPKPQQGDGKGEKGGGKSEKGEGPDGQGGASGESEKGEGPDGQGGASGESESEDGDVAQSSGCMDVHVTSVASTENLQHEWRRAIESAYVQAKSQGKLPGVLARHVQTLLEPQVLWQSHLQLEVSRTMQRSASTWTRPHRRRLVSQGIYLPAYTGHGAGTVVVVVDTSGSIGQKELAIFLSEAEGILSTCHPDKVILIGCDAAINTVVELAYGDSLQGNIPELGGGGGTSFVPPFVWVEENNVQPSALIYLTDMFGDFPTNAPRYPVIWCSSTPDVPAPHFGRVVHINFGAVK